MNENFVLGFIAGEGSFLVKAQKTKSDSDVPVILTPCFEINVNGRESKTIEAISDELPVDCSVYYRDGTSGSGGSTQLYCGGYTKLSPLFDWIEDVDCPAFEQSNKYESFEQIKTIVDLMEDGKHRTRDGIITIMNIRDGMNGGGGECKENYSR